MMAAQPPPAKRRKHSAAAEERHRARAAETERLLRAAVRRGLEILLPGPENAAERQGQFDGIREEVWARKLSSVVYSDDEDDEGDEAPSQDDAATGGGSGGGDSASASAAAAGDRGGSDPESLLSQATPVLAYAAPSDSEPPEIRSPLGVGASAGGSLGSLGSPAAAAAAAPARDAAGTVDWQGQLEAIVGPSYHCCERLALLPHIAPAAKRLCAEAELYAEYLATMRRKPLPALLLLSLREDSAGRSGAGFGASGTAAALRRTMESDRAWAAVRALATVHGLTMLEASRIHATHPTQCTPAKLLESGLTRAQGVALAVRANGEAAAARPETLKGDLARRFAAACAGMEPALHAVRAHVRGERRAEGAAGAAAAAAAAAESTSAAEGVAEHPGYVVQMVVAASESEAAPERGGLEEAVRRLQISAEEELVEHVWEETGAAGRLCAHVRAGEHRFLLDVRAVQRRRLPLAFVWHALGPRRLVRILCDRIGADDELTCGSLDSQNGPVHEAVGVLASELCPEL